VVWDEQGAVGVYICTTGACRPWAAQPHHMNGSREAHRSWTLPVSKRPAGCARQTNLGRARGRRGRARTYAWYTPQEADDALRSSAVFRRVAVSRALPWSPPGTERGPYAHGPRIAESSPPSYVGRHDAHA